MTQPITVLSLFDGISCGRLALMRANIPVEKYFASEIDKNALKVSKHHFPDIVHIGDVQNVKAKNLPKIDLVIGGSPCQGFSFAGRKLNFADPRSRLYFEFERLIKELCPKYYLLENTKMTSKNRNIISAGLGCEPILINSSLVSAQNRQRFYWSNFPISQPNDKSIMLDSIIGKYKGIYVHPRGDNKGGLRSYNKKSPTITCSSWQCNFFIERHNSRDKFTPEQAELLQTLPIGFTDVAGLKKTQRFRLIGNCWTVDVITHIFNCMNGKL